MLHIQVFKFLYNICSKWGFPQPPKVILWAIWSFFISIDIWYYYTHMKDTITTKTKTSKSLHTKDQFCHCPAIITTSWSHIPTCCHVLPSGVCHHFLISALSEKKFPFFSSWWMLYAVSIVSNNLFSVFLKTQHNAWVWQNKTAYSMVWLINVVKNRTFAM